MQKASKIQNSLMYGDHSERGIFCNLNKVKQGQSTTRLTASEDLYKCSFSLLILLAFQVTVWDEKYLC